MIGCRHGLEHIFDPGRREPDARRDGLAALAEAVDGLAAQDLDGLTDAVRAERVLVLRRLVDRLEGQWLKELAAVDARGAAGAEQGQQVGLDRRLAAGPAAHGRRRRQPARSGPPGPCSAAP